jgi:hypothetical protein
MRTPVLLALSMALGTAPLAHAQDLKVKDSITDKPVDELVKGLSGSDTERTVSENELPRRGKAAVAGLVACLQAPENSSEARVAAAKCLRKIKDASAVQPLIDTYKNAGAPLAVRGEAALALGDLNATNAIPDLIEGLANNMFKVSETARIALVAMGDAAVQPLIDAYTKEMAVTEVARPKEKEREAYAARDGIVFRSLLILGDLGGSKARQTLCQALKTNKGSRALGVRHHAGLGIGLLRNSDKDFKLAIEPLLQAYEIEKDFSVASIFVRSLEWLTDAHDVPPQPYRWKAWWNVNKDRVLGVVDHTHDNIELPKDGIKKGDPLEHQKGPKTPATGEQPK